MSADRIAPALTSADVDAALAAQGFGTERPRSGAVVLALLDPPRVVWANRAAATLFDTTDADDLDAQIFAGRGREGLGGTVGRLPADGSPRIERLRLIRGFRSRTLTVLMSRAHLADGRAVAIISAPGHDLPGGQTEGFGASVIPLPAPVVTIPATMPAATAVAAPIAPLVVPAKSGTQDDGGLREKWATLGSARLLWQTDAEGRIVKLSQGVAEMIGVDDPAVMGRPLTEVLQEVGADPEGRLKAALATRAPWSGLALDWPLRGLSGALAVSLGGVPVVTRAGFSGFRGFGVLDLSVIRPGPTRLVAETPVVTTSEPVQDNAPPPPAGVVSVPVAAGPEGLLPDAYPAHQDEAQRSGPLSAKVVALRPHQTFATAPAAVPPMMSPLGESLTTLPPAVPEGIDEADVLDLSTIERSNFHSIGRTLRGEDLANTAPSGLDRPLASLAPVAPAEAPVAAASVPAAPPAVTTPAADTPAARNAPALSHALSTPILVIDGERLIHANPAFAALTGFASLDALRHAGGVAHLFGGLDPAAVLSAEADRAVPLIGATGDVIPLEGRLQRVAWDEGTASLLTFRPPLADRAFERSALVKGLEDQIRRRDADLAEGHATLDRVAGALLTIDRQGRILTLNDAARRLFGHPGEAEPGLVGEPVAMILGAAAQAALTRGEVLADGLEIAARASTGEVLPLRMTWQAVGPQRIAISLRALGEPSLQADLARELAETRDKLDQALAQKPDLLAKISHELRTPLNAIIGFAEVILDERFGPIGNVRYKTYLRDIHESGTHVMSLLNDMLDLSNMEAGRHAMNPAALDVNRVVNECVAELQSSAHRERVIVRLSLLPHLSSAMVDEQAFRQIVGNILSNAINFNEPGGQVIVSTAMSEAGLVAVRIRDTGIGMTEAEIVLAMEPFRQIKAARPGSGNGLGLPLARALVEANGATMSIRSKKDEGTLVEIVLPASPAEQMRVTA